MSLIFMDSFDSSSIEEEEKRWEKIKDTDKDNWKKILLQVSRTTLKPKQSINLCIHGALVEVYNHGEKEIVITFPFEEES